MTVRTFAPALFGIDGRIVSIECDITNGLPGFVVVGLGDKAVDESRERVRSAIKNSGLMLPPRRITLNLAPADLPKDGSGYDLGMAIAVLAASGQLDPSHLNDCLFLGELALDGTVRPVKGAVIAAQLTTDNNLSRLFVPVDNAAEAGLLQSTKVFAISSLVELYRHLLGDQLLSPVTSQPSIVATKQDFAVDFTTIYGQAQAKRAVEIAAAGGHNILLSGPPGTGKTMLAKALMGILPEPTLDEKIEITKLYSLAGQNPGQIMTRRPFRSPHHTASHVALIGGGMKPRPGEISLSHNGVLFLDELPEFPRGVLEVLRQPMEDGTITVARAAAVVTFPARFMLVATQNPCPCGYAGDTSHKCNCEPAVINRYQRKLSGPLLDRIDIVVDVARADNAAIIAGKQEESSADIGSRVAAARKIQERRLTGTNNFCNAYMSNREIKKYCKINSEIHPFATQAMLNLHLSARSYSRMLKVARTIADLDQCEEIALRHFTEAMQYRPKAAANAQTV